MTPNTEKELKSFQKAIEENLAKGMSPQEAVREAYKKYPVMLFMRKELQGELVTAAKKGGANDVKAKELRTAMAKAWAQDGLTLSKRTTKGNAWVIDTAHGIIETALKEGGSVKDMAKKLFNGYGKGGIISRQDIPQFMEKLTELGKDYPGNAFKKALRQAEKNIDKLTTQGMKAAYNGILEAIEVGNEEKVAKAIYVATQEKTRYFAERIARTEKARAYADGMMYKYASDPDCVAFKWKLSTRHPCDDICDMYAKADLYGMGKGIFPKDKVPTLPVHPNCMCRLIPVYEGSPRLKSETPKDRKLDGGMEYIKQLPEVRQKSLLGINGLQMVKRGADWRQYARGYSDKVMTSRIVGKEVLNVCEISPEIYSVISPEMRGREVVITRKQIGHIDERHPEMVDITLKKYKAVLNSPDYIILDPKHEHTGLVIGGISADGITEIIDVVLRIAINGDASDVKHSIISAWRIGEARLRNYLKNKKVIYRKT